MKLPCEIVKDLLPLYEEDLCSPASRAAIEEHLKECQSCREQAEGMQKLSEYEMEAFQSREDETVTDREEAAVARSFRKVHRRWIQSLICMLLVFPLTLMTVNQIRREGICYTNIDDILAVKRYIHALEKGDFEKAAACMDSEGLYEKIQALVVPYPDTDGSEYTTVVLNQESWVATNEFFEEHLRWEEKDMNIWGNLIYNRVACTMFPENIWNEITALEPGSVQKTEDGDLILNGTIYVRLETQWGTYIAEQNSGLQECETAVDFCTVLELVPAEIFKEAYPELEAQALKEYNYLKEQYAEAAAMTLEEFTDIIQAKYIEELKTCQEQGITFESAGYKESYYTSGDGEWTIGYGLVVICGEERNKVTVDFAVREGKLRVVAMGYSTIFPENDTVMEALSMHYIDYKSLAVGLSELD